MAGPRADTAGQSRAVVTEPESTYAAVTAFVDEVVRAGVRHACVSPGARSTPLALCIARHPELHAWSHIDERSGAFFALGMAKASGDPVAVVCTSGSAAANFFPAIVEAAYARVPLLILTADRPPELRDCTAGQTIDQIKLYGSMVKWFAEAGDPAIGERYFRTLAGQAVAHATAGPAGPVHVNFPFREPLVARTGSIDRATSPPATAPRTRFHPATPTPDEQTVDALVVGLRGALHPLVVCGPRDGDDRFPAAVTALAARIGAPVVSDPLSQVRSGPHDRGRIIGNYDVLLSDDSFAERMVPEVILRFGSMPRSKPLQQYLQRHSGCRQLVVDPLGRWNDPTQTATHIVAADPSATCASLSQRLSAASADASWCAEWLAAERRAAAVLTQTLDDMRELFEGKVFSELANLVPDGTAVYVNNSMPVRGLEAFWPVGPKRIRFLCNTGTNGIDGFVSSGLGAAAVSDCPVVMVTGDLGFYHDLNGLLAVRRHGVRATIVVLNNDGGGIFSFLPQVECGEEFEEFFLTPHGLDFRGAVEMYGGRFVRVQSWDEFRAAVSGAVGAETTTVIEVPVDRDRNVELYRAVRDRVRAANGRG